MIPIIFDWNYYDLFSFEKVLFRSNFVVLERVKRIKIIIYEKLDIMESNTSRNNNLIADTYHLYHQKIVSYIGYRIGDTDEAEDMAQDVFVRLLEYRQMVCPETVRNLVYTIAQNLVVDYIRHHYKKQEVYSYIYDMKSTSSYCSPEQELSAKDLKESEHRLMMKLTPACRKVYEMTRNEGLSISEIVERLQIGKRTVESHQLTARKFIRTEMRKII